MSELMDCKMIYSRCKAQGYCSGHELASRPITPDTNDGPSRGERLVKFINGLSAWNLHRGEEALNQYVLDTFMELIGDDEMPNSRMIGVPAYQRDEMRRELRKASKERLT